MGSEGGVSRCFGCPGPLQVATEYSAGVKTGDGGRGSSGGCEGGGGSRGGGGSEGRG